MPQVPLLTPTVSPSAAGTPNVSVPVSGEMFGATIGHALQGLGGALEGAGDKLFTRANEMQNLQNETEVDKADAAYMEKAGMLHAEFSAKQGDEARAAFPKYIEDLKSAREGIKSGLSNPMTQKMFDRTSLSTMGRTIFNGAGHAATQTRMAALDAVSSRIKTTIDTAVNSDDPAQVDAARQKLKGLNWQMHQLKGTPESASDSEHVINSSLDANNIMQIAKKDPFTAKDMLEQKRKENALTKEDYEGADKFVTSQRRVIGSQNTANEVWAQSRGDEKRPELSQEDMLAIGKRKAEEDAPDDPVYAHHVEMAIRQKYTLEKQSQRQETWDAKQEIAIALQNGATNLQQILADPKAAAAYHALDPREQNAIPAQINRYIKARDYADNQRSMTIMDGLRKNDVLQFLDTDHTDPKWKLSQQQIRQVNNWKEEARKNQNGDPQVNRAMSWLRGSIGSQLQALGIYHRDARNPDDYDHFTGELSEFLRAWQDNHGKPAEPKDVTETFAPQLLKTHTTPGILWGTNTSDPAFKDELSSDRFKKFQAEHAKSRVDQGLPEPTAAETERLYYRGLAQTLYGKKDTK